MSAWAAVLLGLVLVLVPSRPVRLTGAAAQAAPATSGSARRRRSTEDPSVPTAAALDLLAACLSAGLPVATAARAVAAATAQPQIAGALRRAADLAELGAGVDQVWSAAAQTPGLAGFAREARRSARSGAGLAEGARAAAADLRRAESDRVLAAGERAGVAVAGPLGLCFLPAFVLLGIGPVVLGLAGEVLGGALG